MQPSSNQQAKAYKKQILNILFIITHRQMSGIV